MDSLVSFSNHLLTINRERKQLKHRRALADRAIDESNALLLACIDANNTGTSYPSATNILPRTELLKTPETPSLPPWLQLFKDRNLNAEIESLNTASRAAAAELLELTENCSTYLSSEHLGWLLCQPEVNHIQLSTADLQTKSADEISNIRNDSEMHSSNHLRKRYRALQTSLSDELGAWINVDDNDHSEDSENDTSDRSTHPSPNKLPLKCKESVSACRSEVAVAQKVFGAHFPVMERQPVPTSADVHCVSDTVARWMQKRRKMRMSSSV